MSTQDIPCLFAPWTDVLPEVQNYMAMHHMDPFTRHYLALTCRTHCASWHTFFKALARPTQWKAQQLSHALGRWATYEDIMAYLNKIEWGLEQRDAVIHGLVREGRDSLLLTFIERTQPLFSLDSEFDMAQSAFVMHRTQQAFEAFKQAILDHPSPDMISMTLIESGYLLERANIPWCLAYVRTMRGTYGAMNDNNIKHVINCLLVSCAQPSFYDGNDARFVHWSDLFQSDIGPRCLEIIQSKDIVAFFYGNKGARAIHYVHAWALLLPYLLPEQQESMRIQMTHASNQIPWIHYVRIILLVIETIGIFSSGPFDADVFDVRYPWTDPQFHRILEHYWTAGKLVLVHDDPALAWSVNQSIAQHVAKTSPTERAQTLTWFREHTFPGSAFIVQCMENE